VHFVIWLTRSLDPTLSILFLQSYRFPLVPFGFPPPSEVHPCRGKLLGCLAVLFFPIFYSWRVDPPSRSRSPIGPSMLASFLFSSAPKHVLLLDPSIGCSFAFNSSSPLASHVVAVQVAFSSSSSQMVLFPPFPDLLTRSSKLRFLSSNTTPPSQFFFESFPPKPATQTTMSSFPFHPWNPFPSSYHQISSVWVTNYPVHPYSSCRNDFHVPATGFVSAWRLLSFPLRRSHPSFLISSTAIDLLGNCISYSHALTMSCNSIDLL